MRHGLYLSGVQFVRSGMSRHGLWELMVSVGNISIFQRALTVSYTTAMLEELPAVSAVQSDC